MWVATAAFIIATFVNYELCTRFVFERGARFNKHHELMLVFLVSAMGLVLTQAILYTMVSMAKIELMISKITATFIVFLWHYLIRKYIVFQKAGHANGTSSALLDIVKAEEITREVT